MRKVADREPEARRRAQGVSRREADDNGGQKREEKPRGLLGLQGLAGNRAVSTMVQREVDTDVLPNLPDVKQETNAVTSFDTIKDAWGHLSSLFHHDKKEGEGKKEEEGDEWEKPSEEAALHVRQVLDGASLALEHVAKGGGSDEAKESAKELAEQLHHGSELVESGAKGFEFLVKAEKYAETLNKIWEASQHLKSLDVQQNREQAADDFGAMVSGFGKLGEALPDGPWSAYFKLMQNVSGEWLRTVGANYSAPQGSEEQWAQVEGMEGFARDKGFLHRPSAGAGGEGPAKAEGGSEAKEPAAKPAALGDLGERVHAIVAHFQEIGMPYDASLVGRFDTAYGPLVAAVDEYERLGALGHLLTQRDATKQLDAKIVDQAREAYKALLMLDSQGLSAEINLLYALIKDHGGSAVE